MQRLKTTNFQIKRGDVVSPVKALATMPIIHYTVFVSKVQEIETALEQLPAEQQWEVAHWLLAQLEDAADNSTAGRGSSKPSLPDYAARRRRIFGDKVLPNMVLTARSDERW